MIRATFCLEIKLSLILTATISADIHELLGITIHSKLTLKKHFNELYKKESQKLNALARISHFIYGF